MMATQTHPPDAADVAAERECIWRIDTREAARQAGIAAEDIERACFWAWRLRKVHAEFEHLGERVIHGKPLPPVQDGGA